MDDAPNGDLLGNLTKLFFDFGPYFLALFLQFFVIAKARSWYSEACLRKEAPATDEERHTYRYYFLGSIVASFVFFGIATYVWFVLNVKNDNQYRVVIDGLSADQSIDQPEYYRQVVAFGDGNPSTSVHRESFMIVSDTPIRKGQEFSFIYGAPPTPQAGSLMTTLTVEYAGMREETFRLDLSGKEPKLVSMSRGGGTTSAGRATPQRYAALKSKPAVPVPERVQ
jgi:hypothetical protein